MAHGTPDWGLTAGQKTVYQLTDMAELAARLGSIVTFDRRGDVIWLDGFEDGLIQWGTSFVGTGGAVAASTARARNGAKSCLLTAGSDSLANALIQHGQPFPALSVMGCEMSFWPDAVPDFVTLTTALRDGVNQTTFEVRYDGDATQWQYLDSAGVYQNIGTPRQLQTSLPIFHTVKLVFDANAGEYARLIVDDATIPLTDITAQTFASALTPHMLVQIALNGHVGTNDTIYVDDVILTQNEPV